MIYEDMYCHLFHCVTKAIDLLEEGDFLEAKKRLIQAQQSTEEMYLRAEGDEIVQLVREEL